MTRKRQPAVRIRPNVLEPLTALATAAGMPVTELINKALYEWRLGYSTAKTLQANVTIKHNIDNHQAFETEE